MDSTRGRTSSGVSPTRVVDRGAGGTADAAPGEAGRRAAQRVGRELGAPLGKELRESALLLGLALAVLGLVTLVAGGALLLG